MAKKRAAKREGQGLRTDLACSKCAGKTATLYVRQPRTPGKEPGFPPIGRICLECGHTETMPEPRAGQCSHLATQPVYKRGPAPAYQRDVFADRCVSCSRVKPRQ